MPSVESEEFATCVSAMEEYMRFTVALVDQQHKLVNDEAASYTHLTPPTNTKIDISRAKRI